jgi:hypothetical protein
MEKAYNFHEMINCANVLDQLSIVEYKKNGLKFGHVLNNQKNVWTNLHPLEEGERAANLADFYDLANDDDIVGAFKEYLKEAQGLIGVLNMAPSSVCGQNQWFLERWVEEAKDPKFELTYKLSKKRAPNKDKEL